jgi:hypothetical protein
LLISQKNFQGEFSRSGKFWGFWFVNHVLRTYKVVVFNINNGCVIIKSTVLRFFARKGPGEGQLKSLFQWYGSALLN